MLADAEFKSQELVNGMLAEWGGQVYEADVSPSHSSKETDDILPRYAKAYAEEFYKGTHAQVVTPQNVRQFLSAHRRYCKLHNTRIQ